VARDHAWWNALPDASYRLWTLQLLQIGFRASHEIMTTDDAKRREGQHGRADFLGRITHRPIIGIVYERVGLLARHAKGLASLVRFLEVSCAALSNVSLIIMEERVVSRSYSCLPPIIPFPSYRET